MNRDRLVLSFRMLRHFLDDCLGIDKETHKITGFEYAKEVLEASAYNTYLETNSNKVDSLYRLIKHALPEMAKHSYLEFIERISPRTKLKEKKVILAFDYTDENFYGKLQGFDIHGCKQVNGVKGKFKFLTCSVVSKDVNERIPLVSIPIRIGHNKASAVTHCLYLIQKQIGEIELILFDRGYYCKELMYELGKLELPYLIFVPKNKRMRRELESMNAGDKKIIKHGFNFRKYSDKVEGETHLAFLKSVFSKRLDKSLDWSFATNCEDIKLDEIICTYRKRWQIETNFRVQDEATIKCKSRSVNIRYFFFVLQQMLQTTWMCFYKEEVSFKKFLIELYKVADDLVKHAKY